MKGYTEEATSVDFSPNGQYIVSGGRHGIVRLWDLRDNNSL